MIVATVIIIFAAGVAVGWVSRTKEVEALKEGMRIWIRWKEGSIDAKEAAKQFQTISDSI